MPQRRNATAPTPNHFPLPTHLPLHTAPRLSPPAGELREYVAEEVNVRCLTPCADPLRYCTVRAEPEWGVLGKRLGRAMAAVAKAVKALPMEVGWPAACGGAGGGWCWWCWWWWWWAVMVAVVVVVVLTLWGAGCLAPACNRQQPHRQPLCLRRPLCHAERQCLDLACLPSCLPSYLRHRTSWLMRRAAA